MTPKIAVLHDVARIPGKTVWGPGAYTDLLASTEKAERPIVAGVWNLQDITEPMEAFDSEWDEVKYVTKGSLVIKDEHTGEESTANAGDFIWFPKGSKSSIVRSVDVTTIYFEQRPGDFEEDSTNSDKHLSERLATLLKWYAESNTESAAAAKAAELVLPGGNTRSVLHNAPFPLVVKSGKSCHVTTRDGAEYLDFISEYSAALYGHSHPKIHEAIRDAMDIGINLGGVLGKETELASLIQDRFPSMELMRFTNSGTEANTMALAAALGHTGHKKILVFTNGYHGSTLSFPKGENPATNLPHEYIIGPYNDIEGTRKLLSYGIAAIIVEPLQSAGGVIPATREFLQFLRDAASTLKAVLIFDEVVTARLDYHGLQKYHDIKPDMTTLGKFIGGGFSIGCFGGNRNIMLQFDPNTQNGLSHSGTFNNNVFSMTAGIAGLQLASAPELLRINALGDRVRTALNALSEKHMLTEIISATGFGSAVGVQFRGASSDIYRDIFYYEMVKRQIMIGRRGFIFFNLTHSDAHADQLIRAITDIIESVSKAAL